MKKNKSFLLTLLLCLLALTGFAQSQKQISTYAIITFVDSYKISQHDKKEYNWIVPLGLAKNDSLVFSRLITEDYSTANICNCLAGKNIEPYISITDSCDKPIKINYDDLSTLRLIINKKKKRFQSIRYNWKSGQIRKVDIFITTVRGVFCSGTIGPVGRHLYNYNGRLFMPISELSFLSIPWHDNSINKIINFDFYNMKFYSIP